MREFKDIINVPLENNSQIPEACVQKPGTENNKQSDFEIFNKSFSIELLKNTRNIPETEIKSIKDLKNIEPICFEIVHNILTTNNFQIESIPQLIKEVNKFYLFIQNDNSPYSKYLKKPENNKQFKDMLENWFCFAITNKKPYNRTSKWYKIISIFFSEENNSYITFPNNLSILYIMDDESYLKNLANLLKDSNIPNINKKLQLADKIHKIYNYFINSFLLGTNKISGILTNTTSIDINLLSKIDISIIYSIDKKYIKTLLEKNDKGNNRENPLNLNDILKVIQEINNKSTGTPKEKIELLENIPSLREWKLKDFINKIKKNNKLLSILSINDIFSLKYLIFEDLIQNAASDGLIGRYKKQVLESRQNHNKKIISKFLLKKSYEDSKLILKTLIDTKVLTPQMFGLKSTDKLTPDFFINQINNKVYSIANTLFSIREVDTNTIISFLHERLSFLHKRLSFLHERPNVKNIYFTAKTIKKILSKETTQKIKQDIINGKDPIQALIEKFDTNGIRELVGIDKENNKKKLEFIIDLIEFISKHNKENNNKQEGNKELFDSILEMTKEKVKNNSKYNNIFSTVLIASIRTQAILECANENGLAKIDSNNVKQINKKIKNYIINKFSTNVLPTGSEQNTENDRITSNQDKSLNNFINNFIKLASFDENEVKNLSKQTFEIPPKDPTYAEFLKQNNLNLSYEQYISLQKLLENEKGLLSQGATSEKISKQNSLLFKETTSNQLEIKHIQINGVYIIEATIPSSNEVLQIKSLTLKDGNKELVSQLIKENFQLNISFEQRTGDDFNKLTTCDITKNVINLKDLEKVETFFQIYFYNLSKNNLLPKDFFEDYSLSIQDIIHNPKKFMQSFNNRAKSKLQIGGLKSMGLYFYLDPFDNLVEQTLKDLNNPAKISQIKEEIKETNTSTIFSKVPFIKKFFS